MDFTERGRDSRFYSSSTGEDNDHRGENSTRRPAFTLTPHSHLPPPSTSSTSSSFPSNWVSSNDDLPGSSGTDNKGTEEQIIPAADIEKEHMFDKVVTPSDVGKLNRLVIPKQHAEKYFPLDSSTNEKGLLLNFEDRNGKAWRFRYSYWNSSQSYVMTKGWSRFVKEKRLDAGDTVSFGRGVGEAGRDRLFIDWKRRPEALNPPHFPRFPIQSPYGSSMIPLASSVVPWSRLYTPSAPSLPPMSAAYNHHLHGQSGLGYNTSNPYLYLRSAIGGPSHSQFHTNPHPHPYPHPHLANVQIQYGGGSGEGSGRSSPIVFDSVPIAQPSTIPTSTSNSKRFRLFGVNLDCSPISNSTGDPNLQREGPSSSSSQVRQLLPPPLSLQLGIGDPSSATTDMVGSPTEDKNQSMSLDLDM